MKKNLDAETVKSFGAEWSAYDQSALPSEEALAWFNAYFAIFPWQQLRPNAVGFDLGCGSGRWARLVAPRVGLLHCIDASEVALSIARRNLHGFPNCAFHHASVGDLPLGEKSMDFGYSLGVLHHVPDTQAGLCACVRLLKPGAPLLIYLYYALDGRPAWFRALWQTTNLLRRGIAHLPFFAKRTIAQMIAASLYWPLARAAKLFERSGFSVENIPLSAYRNSSFYTMQTDALDRFGTRLEQRFTRDQIAQMMRNAGLDSIAFSEEPPHWCAVGRRSI